MQSPDRQLCLPLDVAGEIIKLCPNSTLVHLRLVSKSLAKLATKQLFVEPSRLPPAPNRHSDLIPHPCPDDVKCLIVHTSPPSFPKPVQLIDALLSFSKLKTLIVSAPPDLFFDFDIPISSQMQNQVESGAIPVLRDMARADCTIGTLEHLVFEGTVCVPFLAAHANFITKLEISRVGELFDHYGDETARVHLPNLRTLSIDDRSLKTYSYLVHLDLYTAPQLKTLCLWFHSGKQPRDVPTYLTSGTILDKAHISNLSIKLTVPSKGAKALYDLMKLTITGYPAIKGLHVHWLLEPELLPVSLEYLDKFLSSGAKSLKRVLFHFQLSNPPSYAYSPSVSLTGIVQEFVRIRVTCSDHELLVFEMGEDSLE